MADGVFRFDILVNDRRQRYEFDPDGTKMRGDEAALIEQHAGRVIEWWGRVESGAEHATTVDILLIVFLAARRGQVAEHGASFLEWRDFIASVSPFTLRPLSDEQWEAEATPEVPAPAAKTTARKAAARKPAARKTGPKAVPNSAAEAATNAG
jgi:hypothetical protein